MDPLYSPPPVQPFCQLEASDERPSQTLYTISLADQERLAPYLPPKRTEFLREKAGPPESSLDYYYIQPAQDQPYEVLKTFSERLAKETNPKTLNELHEPSNRKIGWWFQDLTPMQVVNFRKDPAVASIEFHRLYDQRGGHNDIPTLAAHAEKGTLLGPFLKNKPLPHVTLTYAQSLDSQISLRAGQRTTLSGIETKAMTHFLRANHDAILVGAGTANADNPGLNTSFSYDGKTAVGLAEQPRPFVLDPNKSWKVEECDKMFDLARWGLGRAPWWIACPRVAPSFVEPSDSRPSDPHHDPEQEQRKKQSAKTDLDRLERIRWAGGNRIEVRTDQESADGVPWERILTQMWMNGIRSVMIEGGATVINDLLRARNQHLVSSVIVTIAPTYLGAGGVVVAPPRSVQEENEARLKEVTWLPFGQDVVMAGRLEAKS